MPTLAEAAQPCNVFSSQQLQRRIDTRMCDIFWRIPCQGNYADEPLFYEAIKTPEQTLETFNDLRQISTMEFVQHRTNYVRGVTAAVFTHNWKPAQMQELIYVGTWFLMMKSELRNPRYTAQLKTLLKVIQNKITPLLPRASLEMQNHWRVMQQYWERQCARRVCREACHAGRE